MGSKRVEVNANGKGVQECDRTEARKRKGTQLRFMGGGCYM